MTTTKKYHRRPYAPGEDPRPAVRVLAASTLREMGQELALGHTERYERYLRAISVFHNYSANNQRLLMEQCEVRNLAPIYVAKKSLWLRLGYVIEDGQKSLYVWAPKSKRSGRDAPQATELEAELESSAAEEKQPVPRKREFPYVLVPVFGDCQLAKVDRKTGKPFPPLPSFQPAFSQDRSECYACLCRAAEVLGCSVREVQMSDAYGKNHKKEILIDPRPDSTNKTITLAHELAHSLLHWGQGSESLTKKAKEHHAQATAEVVCRYLGVQEETWTRDYLLAFQVTPRELEQDLEIISDAATAIIHALQTAVGFSSPLEVLERNAEQSSDVFAQV